MTAPGAERPRPDWLLLDIDGVLLPPGDYTAGLRRDHGIGREQIQEMAATCFDDCLVGRADLAETLPPWLERWGFPGSPRDFLDRVFADQGEPDPRLLSLVARARRSGLRCGVASNQERWRAADLERRLELAERFEARLFSCRLGARKPDAAFYRHAEAALGVPGAAILFRDDQPANVEAALERGWRAALYAGPDELGAALGLPPVG